MKQLEITGLSRKANRLLQSLVDLNETENIDFNYVNMVLNEPKGFDASVEELIVNGYIVQTNDSLNQPEYKLINPFTCNISDDGYVNELLERLLQ